MWILLFVFLLKLWVSNDGTIIMMILCGRLTSNAEDEQILLISRVD